MYDDVATSCYPERVWIGLQVLRLELSRQLERFSEKQGTYTKTSSQVVLGREAWSYLLSKVATAIRPPIRRHTSAAKRVLQSGLALKSLKQGFSSLFVRFETEEERVPPRPVLNSHLTSSDDGSTSSLGCQCAARDTIYSLALQHSHGPTSAYEARSSDTEGFAILAAPPLHRHFQPADKSQFAPQVRGNIP